MIFNNYAVNIGIDTTLNKYIMTEASSACLYRYAYGGYGHYRILETGMGVILRHLSPIYRCSFKHKFHPKQCPYSKL